MIQELLPHLRLAQVLGVVEVAFHPLPFLEVVEVEEEVQKQPSLGEEH